MTINLVETIQQNLGYPSLKKVDPNTQEVKAQSTSPTILPESFGQAAIPATLTGLFLLVHTKEGMEKVRANTSTNWLETIFGRHSEEAVQKVATYASTDPAITRREMERIAAEAVRLANENASRSENNDELKLFFINQRNTILSYLPASLQMGDLLQNDALDDRTNKMHGPMSDHMHWLEKLFSSSGEAPPNIKTWQ